MPKQKKRNNPLGWKKVVERLRQGRIARES
jgi:hypothetical protein